VTFLAPRIGYDAAARVAKKMLETGKTLAEIVVEEGLISRDEVEKVLDLEKMTRGGLP
jgi:fumarate hydratase class II